MRALLVGLLNYELLGFTLSYDLVGSYFKISEVNRV